MLSYDGWCSSSGSSSCSGRSCSSRSSSRSGTRDKPLQILFDEIG